MLFIKSGVPIITVIKNFEKYTAYIIILLTDPNNGQEFNDMFNDMLELIAWEYIYFLRDYDTSFVLYLVQKYMVIMHNNYVSEEYLWWSDNCFWRKHFFSVLLKLVDTSVHQIDYRLCIEFQRICRSFLCVHVLTRGEHLSTSWGVE